MYLNYRQLGRGYLPVHTPSHYNRKLGYLDKLGFRPCRRVHFHQCIAGPNTAGILHSCRLVHFLFIQNTYAICIVTFSLSIHFPEKIFSNVIHDF